jgi:uncharacterized membrane protein
MVARQTEDVHSRKTTYFHHKPSFFVFFGLLALVILVLIFAGLISFTFENAGPWAILIILAGSLICSSINIPLYKVRAKIPMVQEEFVRWLGLTYRVPKVSYQEAYTQLAVNVGGALIPTAMSVYLLTISASSIVLLSLIGIAIVTAVTYFVARPVKGVGIVTPAFVPPIAAAVVAVVLSPAQPGIIAYVAGTLGTLIGADLLNLGRISDLGAPIASIGGAGTFDGVFTTGIIAVLLATL